jgi:hypothetical protein
LVVFRKEEHKKAIQDLDTLIGRLTKLIETSGQGYQKKTSTDISYYKYIRQRAVILYEVLKKRLECKPACKCIAPHVANLQIQVRCLEEQGKSLSTKTRDLKFQMLFVFKLDDPARCDWREMMVEPLKNGYEAIPKPALQECSNGFHGNIKPGGLAEASTTIQSSDIYTVPPAIANIADLVSAPIGYSLRKRKDTE